MSKPKLYIDFDNTLVNSSEAICELYNRYYNHFSNFTPARWWEVNKYNFTDECPLMTSSELDELFDSEEFFNVVEFMPHASITTLELSFKYDIYIVTMGTPKNLELKQKWINKHMGYIRGFIGIDDSQFVDKSCVDLSDGIHIDDVSKMLWTSNARRRICFGDVCEWNKDWVRERCYNWVEVYRELM